MIVKKITPKDIGRAVGFELMKLRWKYGIRIKHAAHLSGIDINSLMLPRSDVLPVGKPPAVCSNCMTVDVHIELVPRSPETPPSIHKINK